MSSLRLRYRTIEFDDLDIHVRTLRDHLQYQDSDGIAESLGISSATWPLFGVIWASSEVLAHQMIDFEIAGKRILEVGCGIALASLVLSHRLADITATDHHPEVEGFLLENIRLNNGRPIPFVRTDWDTDDDDLGRFDLIIGSDLLYEEDQVELLSSFIHRHSAPSCEVIIVDPGRGLQGAFTKNMSRLGYSHSRSKPSRVDYLTAPFNGSILSYRLSDGLEGR